MANKNEKQTEGSVNSTIEFYQKLTNLFRSGVNIQRKLKGYDYTNIMSPKELAMQGNLGYPSYNAYRHSYSGFVGMGYFGVYDRIYRFREYVEMDAQSPECATALDTIADEICAADRNDVILHIETDNIEVRKALDELFFDVCQLNSDLRYWVRSMLKFGDFYLYMDVREREGIVNVDQIPAPDCERQEKFDPNDPHAVRYKITAPNLQTSVGNNQQNKNASFLENFQVANFRFLSNDAYRPHGTSWLDGARRPYRVLMMLIDAMLTYRIVRSPARRVFYVDTTGINPNDVEMYMRNVEEGFKGKSVVSSQDGKQDIRWNPSSMLEDYFIPIKRDSLTKIDTLEGATHQTAVDDVAFVHKQLTAALKMPRAFLGYDEAVGKNNLSAQDIRFSKTVSSIQKVVLAELKRMAIIHLYAKGFDGEDLINFRLKLTNPSTAAMLQKLELLEKQIDIASKAKDIPHLDEEYIQKSVFEMNDAEIIRTRLGREQDAIRNKTIDALKPVQESPPIKQDIFDTSNYDVPGGSGNAVAADSAPNQIVPQQQHQQSVMSPDLFQYPKIETEDLEPEIVKVNIPNNKAPIKPNFVIGSKLTSPMIVPSNYSKQIVNPYYGINMADQQNHKETGYKPSQVTYDEYYGNLLREAFKEHSTDKIPTRGIYREITSSLKNFRRVLNESALKKQTEELEILVESDDQTENNMVINEIFEIVKNQNNI